MLQGLAAFRWAAWGWMALTLVASRHELARPWMAIGLVLAALAVTTLATALLRRDPVRLLGPALVAGELLVGAALVLCDGWAYRGGHSFSTHQSLGSVWPLVGILNAGVATAHDPVALGGARRRGPLVSAAVGVSFGLARVGSTLANGVRIFDQQRVLSLLNTTVFYALGGAVAAYAYVRMREAEGELADARAREELARTLHDGVLQTLALVERRTDDPALARLARDQERELRDHLFGPHGGDLDLGASLRTAAARWERAYGGRVEVLMADDLPVLSGERVDALAGAVGEALTNAGKHGAAQRVVVFVEPTDVGPGRTGSHGTGSHGTGSHGTGSHGTGSQGTGSQGTGATWKRSNRRRPNGKGSNGKGSSVFCSVKDDGSGFDPAAAVEGVGISRSIRGRMTDVGGWAEISGRPGEGAEVRLWV